MTDYALPPIDQYIERQRQSTLSRCMTSDEMDLFDALHHLRMQENFQGHFLCIDPMNGHRWERMVQGVHQLSPRISDAAWRTSVDSWIKEHPTLPRFGTSGNKDASYRFWKQVLREVLVPQERVNKLRSVDRQIWPAVTSPTPQLIREYLATIHRRLEREESFVPTVNTITEILSELDMIVHNVPYYQDLVTNTRVTYPGPYVRCTQSSAKLLRRIGRRHPLHKEKRKAGRAAVEYIIATAQRLGLTVPAVEKAFPHFFPKSGTSDV